MLPVFYMSGVSPQTELMWSAVSTRAPILLMYSCLESMLRLVFCCPTFKFSAVLTQDPGFSLCCRLHRLSSQFFSGNWHFGHSPSHCLSPAASLPVLLLPAPLRPRLFLWSETWLVPGSTPNSRMMVSRTPCDYLNHFLLWPGPALILPRYQVLLQISACGRVWVLYSFLFG